MIEKPWGTEEILEHNDRYVLKKLTMKKGHRCSLQYHEKKKETIYILSGVLCITWGKNKNELQSHNFTTDDVFTINPMEIHRMSTEIGSVYLETSTPELDDVIRIEDDYDRE